MTSVVTMTILLVCLPHCDGQVHLYQELDSHETRLTAMEQTVMNLTKCCATAQQNYQEVKHENDLLKEVVLNLTARLEALEQTATVAAGQQTIGGQTQMTATTSTIPYTSNTPVSSSSSSMVTKTTATTTPKVTPKDCADAQRMGSAHSGLYTIHPEGGVRTYEVYCDLEQDGGGWTTIQRRVDGTENFERNWNDYKSGFGNITRNFWIGNDLLYTLTSRGPSVLHITIGDWQGVHKWAEYQNFYISSESSWYQLSVGKYTGTAGDSFHYPDSYMLSHSGLKFSTPDRDNDRNFQHCARLLKSGWWFNSCYSSNLNGPYLSQPSGNHIYGESWGQPSLEGTGIEWYPWRKHQYSFKYAEMKISA